MNPASDLGFDLLDLAETTDGHRLVVRVRADAPAFRGHFPNRPILPGVAQLTLLEQALGIVHGHPQALAEVNGVRLRRIVGPNETITLELRSTETATFRFDLRAEGESVSSGSFRALEPQTTIESLAFLALEAELEPHEPFEAEGRVPHAPPARLVERLVAWNGDAACAEAKIPAESPFAASGRAPTLLAIEIAAQTAALFEAASRGSETSEAPREGYLVLVRRAHFATANLPTATRLHATIRLAGSAPPLALYEFSVGLDGVALANGVLGTFLTETESGL